MNKKKQKNKKVLIVLIVLVISFIMVSVVFLMLNNRQDEINSDVKNASVITRSKIKYGDVNDDNQITVKDQSVILKHLSGTTKLTGNKLKAADVNLDGNVDNKDLALVRKYVVGTITKLPIRYGDANDDNKIDANDLSAMQKHVLGVKKLTGNGFVAGDVNSDGKITNSDVTLVQKYLAGIITKLTIKYGDVNNDNKINANDLSAIKKHVLGTKKLTGSNLEAADVNLNGSVTNTDVNLLQKYLAGQVPTIPISLNVQAEFLAVAEKELGNDGTKYKNFFGMDDEWCVMFVFWVAAHTSVDGANNLCTSNKGSSGCVYNKYINLKSAVVYQYAELMAKNNKFYHSKYYASKYGTYKDGDKVYTPQPGDLIFFIDESNYSGNPKNCYAEPKHIGIVQEVTKTQIFTIEGNTGSTSHYESKVSRNSYKLGSTEILGYAHWGD